MSDKLLRNAMELRRAGKLAEAARLYGEILSTQPKHYEALHALGTLRYQMGSPEEAEKLIGEAIAVNPRAPDAFYNRACLLQRLNRLEEARDCFQRAIDLKPDYIEALVNISMVLTRLGRHQESLAALDRVVARIPNLAEAWSNRGSALMGLNCHAEAVASFDKALALKDSYPEAWKNRGLSLGALGRYAEALESFERAYALNPNDRDVLVFRAEMAAESGRHQEALAAYDLLTQREPKDAAAWIGRAMALHRLMRREEAVASLNHALQLQPDVAGMPDIAAMTARANILYEMGRFDEAARDYSKTLEFNPDIHFLKGYLAYCHLHCCDWRDLDAERAELIAGVRAAKPLLDPMAMALISSSTADQFDCARIFVRERFPAERPLWRGERYDHARIRVGYVSADFHTHATPMLMAGVFERHDPTRFETIAFSLGPDDLSPMRARLKRAFDRFIDVRLETEETIARRMREMEIDIVVDLKGHTGDSKARIFAYRAAPVQATYLGFPGTTGADYMDYIIADRIVLPDDERRYYSEKVVLLPDSYQCNDFTRIIAPKTPTRTEAGLPERGFVFCCFNNNQKINPEMFDIWTRLLRAVEDSVLWLLPSNATAVANLRREVEARGIAPERMVIAPRVEASAHLARHRLADLFLDTLPYNAHTTASDALWAGLPVLTCKGTTFAGRVAASLLGALDMPELIVDSPDAYEAMALKLARDPALLAALKDKLARNRASQPLFDTVRFTQHLESAYVRMWQRAQQGQAPESFAVAPVSKP